MAERCAYDDDDDDDDGRRLGVYKRRTSMEFGVGLVVWRDIAGMS